MQNEKKKTKSASEAVIEWKWWRERASKHSKYESKNGRISTLLTFLFVFRINMRSEKETKNK